MARNFAQFAQMPVVDLKDGSLASMDRAAEQMLTTLPTATAPNPDLRPGSAAGQRC